MKFQIYRGGRKYGPYPAESLGEMLRSGNVVATDLMLAEGRTEWVRVSDYLTAQAQASSDAPRSNAPPILAPAQVAATGFSPLASGQTSSPPVLEGSTELERQVLAGGRFVIYQYCISVLVMTFKRPSEIILLRRDQDGFKHALSYSLISLFAGWWGFPWGPIWTVATLVRNASGGLDVTQAVLTEQVGPIRAEQIMARRLSAAPRGLAMKLFPWALGAVPVLIGLLVMLTILGAGQGSSFRSRQPGGAEFKRADRELDFYRGTGGTGNSPKAAAIANKICGTMTKLRQVAFQGGKPTGFSLSGHHFLTYCELRDSQCAILIHVPELRSFTGEAKIQLGEMAWSVAQDALKQQNAGRPGLDLAVGLRGVSLYDRVLVGKILPEITSTNMGIVRIAAGSEAEEILIPFFRPVARVLSAPEPEAVNR